jgi:hypothetical protein
MNPFRWLWPKAAAPAGGPTSDSQPEPTPLPVRTREEKLQRRATRLTEMQREGAVYLGDCHECWLPLPYPPIRFTALDSLVWSVEPGKAEGRPEHYCLECLPLGAARYQDGLAKGIVILGTPAQPKVDNG